MPAAEAWGAHLLHGELTVHLVEGRNFGVALRELGVTAGDGPQTCYVKVKRKGDKGYRTESKPVRIGGGSEDLDRTEFDARLTWRAPPAFDVLQGRLEFELAREDGTAVARAHVGLQYLVHVSPGQTHTVSFLLVPKTPGDPPIKLARETSPGVKIVIYPDFPSAAPSPSHLSEARTVGLSPRGSPQRRVDRSPSPRPTVSFALPHDAAPLVLPLPAPPKQPPPPPPPVVRKERPTPAATPAPPAASAVTAVLVRIPEGRAFPGGVAKCAMTYRGRTQETAVAAASPKPQWSATQTFRFPVAGDPANTGPLHGSYLHIRVFTDPQAPSPPHARHDAEAGRVVWDTLGSVDVELGHIAERDGVDTWVGVDADMKSRLVRSELYDKGDAAAAASTGMTNSSGVGVGNGYEPANRGHRGRSGLPMPPSHSRGSTPVRDRPGVYTPGPSFPPPHPPGEPLPHQVGSVQTPVGVGSGGWVRVVIEFERGETVRNAAMFWSERARRGLNAPTLPGGGSPQRHHHHHHHPLAIMDHGNSSAHPIWSVEEASGPAGNVTAAAAPGIALYEHRADPVVLPAYAPAAAPAPLSAVPALAAAEDSRISPLRGSGRDSAKRVGADPLSLYTVQTPGDDGYSRGSVLRGGGGGASILDQLPTGEHVVVQPPPMWGVAGPIETLHKWLHGLGLDHTEQRTVAATLARRGVRDLATVLQLNETDLVRLGFDAGVRRKLLAGIHA